MKPGYVAFLSFHIFRWSFQNVTCALLPLRSFHTVESQCAFYWINYVIFHSVLARVQSITAFTEFFRYFSWASVFRISGVKSRFLTCGLWPLLWVHMTECNWMEAGLAKKKLVISNIQNIFRINLWLIYSAKSISRIKYKVNPRCSGIDSLCCSMWLNCSLGAKKHTCALCTACKATLPYWQRLSETFVCYELLFCCTYKVFWF